MAALNPLHCLEIFNISSNNLVEIDTANMPNLQVLNIDRNSICSIEGVKNLKRLVTLSWREQSLDLDSGFTEVRYQDCQNIHKLYLSGNILPSFTPALPFLNLCNLELAATGLKTLAPDFGQKLPNLRILNLNYNAVCDLRPLLGIVKLQRLFLAGNRISRLRQTSLVLQRLSNELEEVDLRQNPLTTGFYTPQEPTSSSKPQTQIALKSLSHPPPEPTSAENDAETQAAKAYLLPPPNQSLDAHYRTRLDEDTQLRRRVYEMLIVGSCRDLRILDGMQTPRKALSKKDGVWERLLELGVLRAREREREREERVGMVGN